MATNASATNTIEVLSAAGAIQNGIDSGDHKTLLTALQNGARLLEMDQGVHALPYTINPGGSIMSPPIPSFDLPRQVVGVISNQAGSVVLNRFLDRGGAFLLDSTTSAMTANVACSIALADSKYTESLQVKISNTAVVAASLSSILIAVGQ